MTDVAVQKRPLTFVLFLLRLLSGIVGGVAGTIALFIIYFVFFSLVPTGDESTSISSFVIIIMAFIGTLTANTVTAVMVTFMDNAKYSRRKTIITQVFLFNLILFLLTIPLYLIGISLDIINYVAALHFLLSAFVSSLIMEVIAGTEYSLLGIYSSAVGIFASIFLAFVLLLLKVDPKSLIFAAMPTVWVLLQVSGAFMELIYDNFLRFYGVDALNSTTDLGGDDEKEPEEEENPEDKGDKEDGAY